MAPSKVGSTAVGGDDTNGSAADSANNTTASIEASATSSTTDATPRQSIKIWFQAYHYKPELAMQEAKLAFKSVEECNGDDVEGIYIRRGLHPSTASTTDTEPPGSIHLTVHYKSAAQMRTTRHSSVHTYTYGKNDYELRKTVYLGEEADYDRRRKTQKWPDSSATFEYYGERTSAQLRT